MLFAFYFQASQTSNTFYDNTYKFTKDTSEVLGRMEGMFGEKLSHLNDNYTRMDIRLEQFSPAKAKEELSESKAQADESADKRDELIESLIEKAQLQGAERDKFLERLQQAEEQLISSRESVALLEQRLRNFQRQVGDSDKSSTVFSSYAQGRLESMIRRELISRLGGSERSANMTLSIIRHEFRTFASDLPDPLVSLMQRKGYIRGSDSLTLPGAHLIQITARDFAIVNSKQKRLNLEDEQD